MHREKRNEERSKSPTEPEALNTLDKHAVYIYLYITVQ